jgi:hypothetical protein
MQLRLAYAALTRAGRSRRARQRGHVTDAGKALQFGDPAQSPHSGRTSAPSNTM